MEVVLEVKIKDPKSRSLNLGYRHRSVVLYEINKHISIIFLYMKIFTPNLPS